ncbi:MAG: ribosome assembly factor SBDS [Nanoarchaeota archaeon]|nr:ribosome assembly factor SBDS [Nanoarchaeota archaeon]
MAENSVARIRVEGKHFEVVVEDIEKALKFKKTGEGSVSDFLAIGEIFTDSKKGERASESDLQKAFGTDDEINVAEQIVKRGEVQVPMEYKQDELSERGKQMIEFFVKNATDPRSDRPYTSDRIESAFKEASVNITNKPIEAQIKETLEAVEKVLPIKIEIKKLKVTIPAQYTGSSYSALQNYKESEDWLGNGDLCATVKVPKGLIMEFYDKLNAMTHGAAISEEIKEESDE